MIDEKLLDRMNFGELNQALEYVIERIDGIEDERPKGADDPRLDALCIIANKIIRQMDAIMREHGNPEAIAQWDKAMAGYKEGFKTYSDILREEGTRLDLEKPATS